MSLTKVKATVLGFVHLVKTCAARRSRDDVAGKAATPKNARHRQRTADRDFVANIFCVVCKAFGESREKVHLTGGKCFLGWRPYKRLTAFRRS